MGCYLLTEKVVRVGIDIILKNMCLYYLKILNSAILIKQNNVTQFLDAFQISTS